MCLCVKMCLVLCGSSEKEIEVTERHSADLMNYEMK